MYKRMKAQGITLSSLTKEVNKTTHVCEQEMINYMLVPEEMPDEVETALKDIFMLHGIEQKNVQMCMEEVAQYEIYRINV